MYTVLCLWVTGVLMWAALVVSSDLILQRRAAKGGPHNGPRGKTQRRPKFLLVLAAPVIAVRLCLRRSKSAPGQQGQPTGKGRRSKWLRPTDHGLLAGDPMGFLAVQIKCIRRAPLLATLLWLVVMTAASMLPFLAGKKVYYETTAGLITTIAYGLFVPLLLGSYLFLVVSAERALSPRVLRRLGLKAPVASGDGWRAKDHAAQRSGRLGLNVSGPPQCCRQARARWGPSGWKVLLWLLVGVLTMGTLFPALACVENYPWRQNGWISQSSEQGAERSASVAADDQAATAGWSLNWAGMVYYVARGINGMMALGMLVTTMFVWRALNWRVTTHTPEQLYTQEGKVRPEVVRLGMAVMLTATLASIVATFQGIALASVASLTGRKEAFFHSTWLLWVLLTVVMACVSLTIILRLHSFLRAGAARMQRISTRGLPALPVVPVGQEGTSNFSDVARGCADYWKARQTIREWHAKINTWPFPLGGYLVVTALAGLQVLNLLFAVVMSALKLLD